jgi:CubicO group peptidase (beta-lactamase class C family)
MGPAMISGTVAPGFEPVREQFEANFARRGELGAAVAAYRGGEKVVDLWGGHRDARRREPWLEDTMVMVYSTSKGLAAMCVALAHSRGLLGFDDTVAQHWPEFAANGKEAITVRQLLAHQAGLCAVDERMSPRTLRDLDGMARTLARQRPGWEPGTRHGYHALSIGWYENELIRRVDPQRRSLGRFFAQEIAEPLGIEFYFGLPDAVARERVAPIKASNLIGVLLHARTMPPGMIAAFVRPRSFTARTFGNPRLRSAASLDSAAYRAVENPAAGGIGQVRDVARAYSVLATGGAELGLSPATIEELSAPAGTPSKGPRDLVLTVDSSYSLGYVRPTPEFRFGINGRAFGHPGAGGSFAFADPDARVAFAYAPNRHGHHLRDDPREKALRDALYACL